MEGHPASRSTELTLYPSDLGKPRTGAAAMPMIDVYATVGTFADKHQLAVVERLTQIVAAAAGDLTLAERTWVLLTEAIPGGWGLKGHANTNDELVNAARAQIAELQARS